MRPDLPPVVVRASSRRVTGLVAAVLGVVAAWLLAGPQQYAADELSGGHLPYLPDSWGDAFRSVYDGVGDPLGMSAYYFWGHFAFLIYVAGIVAVRALPHGTCRRSRIGRRLLVAAFVIGLVGDVLAYWGGLDEITTLTDIGFIAVEVPAMLLMLVSLVVYGLGQLADGLEPRWSAWVLLAGAVAMVPSSIWFISYIPHGVLAPVLVAIALCLAGARQEVIRGGSYSNRGV